MPNPRLSTSQPPWDCVPGLARRLCQRLLGGVCLSICGTRMTVFYCMVGLMKTVKACSLAVTAEKVSFERLCVE